MKTHITKYASIVFAFLSFFVPDLYIRVGLRTNTFPAPFSAPFVPAFFTVFWISFFLIICFASGKKWGRRIFVLLASIANIWFVSNCIYYEIFHQFLWLDSIALAGEAGEYAGIVTYYLSVGSCIIFAVDVVFIVLACVYWQLDGNKKAFRLILVPVLLMFMLNYIILPKSYEIDYDDWNSPNAVYESFSDSERAMDVSGLYQDTFRNACRIISEPFKDNKTELEKVDKFFAEKPEHQPNEMTGLLEGKNVVAIMLESMDSWLINEKYTPTIYNMMQNSINFASHFAPTFSSGYTFNTEYSFNTGFHSPNTGRSGAFYSNNAYPYALPRLFADKGYLPRSFHFNTPKYYNRGNMHTAFGYESYTSYLDYIEKPLVYNDSVILDNDEIYKKMVEGEKFFDFVVTYTAHMPYTYEDDKLKKAKELYPELIDSEMDEEVNNMLILAHDTDEYVRKLCERLAKDGLMSNTVFVVFTDHYAYGYSDISKLEKIKTAMGCKLIYQLPFFIYGEGVTPMEVTKVSNTLDILPTVVNLFGLDYSKKHLGNDIFDPAYEGYAYFSNGSWITNKYYFSTNGDQTGNIEKSVFVKYSTLFSTLEEINDLVVKRDYFGTK